MATLEQRNEFEQAFRGAYPHDRDGVIPIAAGEDERADIRIRTSDVMDSALMKLIVDFATCVDRGDDHAVWTFPNERLAEIITEMWNQGDEPISYQCAHHANAEIDAEMEELNREIEEAEAREAREIEEARVAAAVENDGPCGKAPKPAKPKPAKPRRRAIDLEPPPRRRTRPKKA